MRAAVTGAAGFIGMHLCRHLREAGWDVRALTRFAEGDTVAVGDLANASHAELRAALAGADVVFHLAGRAHRSDRGRDPRLLDAYRRDNVQATERVYRAACDVGAQRFVHFSTIKVLGEVSGDRLGPLAPCDPQDAYSRSKHEAEQRLRELTRDGVPVTVVRPPLVFGPGVKGNFARLVRWVRRGWPLPLGAARAPRSVLFVDNLCDLMTRLIRDDADYRVAHVRDVDVDVATLVSLITTTLASRTRCVVVPARMIEWLLTALGRRELYQSLFEPLRVDDDATRRCFDWTPRTELAAAIAATVAEGTG